VLVVSSKTAEVLEKIRSREIHIIPRREASKRFRPKGWNPLKALFPIYPVPYHKRR
jgi:hypothetical protein